MAREQLLLSPYCQCSMFGYFLFHWFQDDWRLWNISNYSYFAILGLGNAFPNLRLAYRDDSTLKIFLSGRDPIYVSCPKLVMNSSALLIAKNTYIANAELSNVEDAETITAIQQNGFYIPVRQHGDEWYVCLQRGLTTIDFISVYVFLLPCLLLLPWCRNCFDQES